jgi:hybrid cluster-associated redox disulfide protein
MEQITKDMLISDILAVDPSIAAILMASGMHCVGCPASQGEELQEACAVHGMQVDEVLKDINEYLAKKSAQ